MRFTIRADFPTVDGERGQVQRSYKVPDDLSESSADNYECKMENAMSAKNCDFDYSYTLYVEYRGRVYGTVLDLFETLRG